MSEQDRDLFYYGMWMFVAGMIFGAVISYLVHGAIQDLVGAL
jgi:hypothetical protein